MPNELPIALLEERSFIKRFIDEREMLVLKLVDIIYINFCEEKEVGDI